MSTHSGYCLNTVVFTGARGVEILEYFKNMEEHSPPFLSILVADGRLNFDSRWIPPIRSLNEIAEMFDVSYDINYRVPFEDRGNYRYTCLQDQPLSAPADQLRQAINAAVSREQLAITESELTKHILSQSLNLHELEVLSHLTGKRYNDFRLSDIQQRNAVPKPWENGDSEPRKRIGR